MDAVAAKASMFGGLVASSAHVFCLAATMNEVKKDEATLYSAQLK